MRELFDGYKHKIQQEYGCAADDAATAAAASSLPVEEQPMTEHEVDDVEPFNNIICRLTVNNVSLDDCGEIECRASNSGGVDVTRAKLKVHSRHHFSTIAVRYNLH